MKICKGSQVIGHINDKICCAKCIFCRKPSGFCVNPYLLCHLNGFYAYIDKKDIFCL